jgi:hypothetical protein
MRYILIFWAAPLGFFWSWYFLSFHDVSLGTKLLSRQTHDLVFAIYGHFLGLDRDTIVTMVAKACVFDTFIIFGILGFRRRKEIKAWWNNRRAVQPASAAEDNIANLSSAP